MATAKVFEYGGIQVVKLPKEFWVEGDEVEVSRVGRAIVLRPQRITYEDALSAVRRFISPVERDHDRDQNRAVKRRTRRRARR